ncbi:hypothetical protein L2750_18775 [Shewanella submarina]|uniref:Uncharacterized protein n=1 Tax=Shewanella submarina TaxID=2016376 RepID=A0ABV7GGP4_9GAMM|nr:hypothetical protein [Shewanella submarina]MCL1039170.1 hypothetical protein [Shewanella submarina]
MELFAHYLMLTILLIGALLFYMSGSVYGMWGLVALGVVLELTFWIKLLRKPGQLPSK